MRALVLAVLAFTTAMPAYAESPDKPPSVTYDTYTKTENITGQLHSHNALFNPVKPMWWLQAAIVEKVPHNPMLILAVDMPSWAFFDAAHDSDGNALPVHQIQRRLSDLSQGVYEAVGIELTPQYLTAHADTGLNIRVEGSQGSHVMIVSKETIRPFLDAYKQRAGL